MSFLNVCECGEVVTSQCSGKYFDECSSCYGVRMRDIFGRKFNLGDSVCYRTSTKNYNNLAFGKVIEIQSDRIRVAKIVKIGDTFRKGNVSSLYNDNVFIINDDFLEKKLEVLNVY